MDVDGVLTDGRLYYGPQGESLKAFHARDGYALKLWHQLGFGSLIISGRESSMVQIRAQELGIRHLFVGVADKVAEMNRFCQQTKTDPKTIAHIGDDLPDLPLMLAVGLAISVADGHRSVREHAAFVTEAAGGAGAVSEAVHKILVAQNLWETALKVREFT